MDEYSCGFIAALAVARYYRPETDPERLLAAVRPTEEGCDEDRLLWGLRRFGVRVRRRRGLTSRDVFGYLSEGKPVIVLVDLPELACDHWAVIRGLDRVRKRVYLVNHGSWDRPGMDWQAFRRRTWRPAGLGWVCSG
jgi:hypothetical protein